MSDKIVDIRDVRIKTLTVQVRTITLGAKQVTLSVFRQIPERRIWACPEVLDFTLLGEPWGRVNYRPSPDAAAWWLVWSDGKGLYRMPLWDLDVWFERFKVDESSWHALEKARRYIEELRAAQGGGHVSSAALEWAGLSCGYVPDPARRAAVLVAAVQKAEERVRTLEDEWERVRSLNEELMEKLEDECDALEALPQLFIAV